MLDLEGVSIYVLYNAEKISERFLIPVLEHMLDAFPFVIK